MDVTTVDLTLGNDDFLVFQLYTASKSPTVRQARFKSRLVIPVLYLLIAVVFLLGRNYALGGAVLAAGGLWFLFYPAYSRRKYRKHYQKHIAENYRNRVGVAGHLKLTDDSLHIDDVSGQSAVKLVAIAAINELPGHYFIKLKQDVSLILPKSMAGSEVFITELEAKTGLARTPELAWVWR